MLTWAAGVRSGGGSSLLSSDGATVGPSLGRLGDGAGVGCRVLLAAPAAGEMLGVCPVGLMVDVAFRLAARLLVGLVIGFGVVVGLAAGGASVGVEPRGGQLW